MTKLVRPGSGRSVVGTIAIVAGVLLALATSVSPGGGGAYVVAALVVAAGVGLRIEAAILDARDSTTMP